VTSPHFEGLALKNPQVRRGHSGDRRSDCKQVCLVLVVRRDGIPPGYEIFEDNLVDVTTVEQIAGTMEARFGLAGRIWVTDRPASRRA
jgi:transposase